MFNNDEIIIMIFWLIKQALNFIQRGLDFSEKMLKANILDFDEFYKILMSFLSVILAEEMGRAVLYEKLKNLMK